MKSGHARPTDVIRRHKCAVLQPRGNLLNLVLPRRRHISPFTPFIPPINHRLNNNPWFSKLQPPTLSTREHVHRQLSLTVVVVSFNGHLCSERLIVP